MTPERVAQIRGLLANTATGGYPWVRSAWPAMADLLAEVDRLTRQAAIKDQAIESLRRTLNHATRAPRCGLNSPGLIPGTYVGPCTLPHGHEGSHEDDHHTRWSETPDAPEPCGGEPSDFLRALGFGEPCDLGSGHGGDHRHGETKQSRQAAQDETGGRA